MMRSRIRAVEYQNMPNRSVAGRELAEVLGVLSHPHRLRIVEKLRGGELDVRASRDVLEISRPGGSQHLGGLRAHRLVVERRERRHVFYRFRRPELAAWPPDGLPFIGGDAAASQQLRRDVRRARAEWSALG
jgi:DNA-binding transcriptional ArsR family regulator